MIAIVKRDHAPLKSVRKDEYCEIIADTESDILALGVTVTDADETVVCAPGSVAYTADMAAIYQLSPGGVWTKANV